MKRLIFLAALVCTAATAAAQNYIVVNSEKIFKSLDAYNTAISDLDELAKQYQAQVFAAIEAYARTAGADVVLDSSNNPTLLYSSPAVERTQQVIDALKK